MTTFGQGQDYSKSSVSRFDTNNTAVIRASKRKFETFTKHLALWGTHALEFGVFGKHAKQTGREVT
nr:hypothetical protein GCM10023233_04350 [Brevibacterium otitidis]